MPPPPKKKLTKREQEALRLKRESMKKVAQLQLTAPPPALPQIYPPFIPAFPPAANSEFQKYADNGTSIQTIGETLFAWRIIINTDEMQTLLAPNYMRSDRRIYEFTYFIVDHWDLQHLAELFSRCASAVEKKNIVNRSFRKMSVWVKERKDHGAFLRYLPLLTGTKNQEEMYFFVDDVLETILVVKYKQDCPLRHNDERFKKYQDLWKLEHRKKIYETISLEQLHEVFDEFGCDKTLVKLIEDPVQFISRREYHERGGYIRTLTQNMVNVMPAQMAALYILDGLIKGVNWNKYQCPGHDEEDTPIYNCREGMKALIMKQLRELVAKKTSYVSIQNIQDHIIQYRTACIESYIPPISNPNYMFNGLPGTLNINIIIYMFPASVYELPYFANITSTKLEDIPVWMAKVFIGLGWLVQFFEDQKPEDHHVAHFVGEALLYMVPDEYREKANHFIRNVLNKDIVGSYNYPPLLEFAKVMPSQPLTKQQKQAAKRQRQKSNQKNQAKPPTVLELLDPRKTKTENIHFEKESSSKPQEPEKEVVYESDFEEYTESEDESLNTDTFSGSSEGGSESPNELLTTFSGLIVQNEILERGNRDYKYQEEFEPDVDRRRPLGPRIQLEREEVDPADIQRMTEKLDRIVSQNKILEKRLQQLQEAYRIHMDPSICTTFMMIRDLEQENVELTQVNTELLDKNRELEEFVKEVLEFLKE
ncbi:hypothetical protein CAEBREN_04610 [Caenorhabditis brenneri]|uniref:Uncharacterized protein n=1 Tax=Caenorhabditis brenneri TaxID=135651 RepID=G0N678_CAEBE|nr:hypothetical protein CAEBREN_04610 [Caenorhabditis brenneri]